MKKLILLPLIISCLFFINTAQAQPSKSELAAIDVVNKYFAALQQGDVNTIKTVLGGNLLRQTENYLDQANYGTQLVARFSGSTLDIASSRIINDNTVVVNAVIQINADEQLKLSYKLQDTSTSGQFLINSEVDW